MLNVNFSRVPIKRSDVQFNQSLGRGWFGWIVEGQAKRTLPNSDNVIQEKVSTNILYTQYYQFNNILLHNFKKYPNNKLSQKKKDF